MQTYLRRILRQYVCKSPGRLRFPNLLKSTKGALPMNELNEMLKVQINLKDREAFEKGYVQDLLKIPAPKWGCPLSLRYADNESEWIKVHRNAKHSLVDKVSRALNTDDMIFEIDYLERHIIFKTPQNPFVGTYRPEWAFDKG